MSIVGRFFFFFSHIDFSFKHFFLWMFMKFMSIFERFLFFWVIYWFFIWKKKIYEFSWSSWVFLEDFSFFLVILIFYFKFFLFFCHIDCSFQKKKNFYEFSWSLWVFWKIFIFCHIDFSFQKKILSTSRCQKSQKKNKPFQQCQEYFFLK